VRHPLQRRRGQSERQALQELAGRLSTTPLDPARPLWQFHFVEQYEGGSALIARVHHCIADGIALISVMLSITDGGADPPARKLRKPADDSGGDWLTDAVVKPFTDLTVKAIGMYGSGVAKSMEMLANPYQPLFGSLDMARSGYQVLSDVAAMALMSDDSPTLLKGKPVGTKKVAWGEPIPLDEVKAVGKALGCSVNDVLLACVAGAIGGYLGAQGDDPTGKEIRAMVPVNLRPLEKAYQLGNRFGLVPLVLPVGIDNPIERVYAVRRRMTELKGSYQPLLAFAVLAVAGLLIKPAQDALLNMFAKKTAVMTNVPGPAKPLKFCGSTLRQTMFWVPQSGNVGVGVSILSYGGGVQFGLITDEQLCPDPQRIIERFQPEFEKLLMVTLMLPKGGGCTAPPAPSGRGLQHEARARRAAPGGVKRSSVLQLRLGHLHVQPFHRVHRLARGGLGVELLRLLHLLLAFEHHQPVRVLHHRDRRARVELQRLLVHREPGVLARALGAAQQRADLVDHLGMEGAQRDVGVGVLGLQPDGRLERGLDLAAEALRQRLGHADALAVATQRIRHEVVRVGVLRLFRGLRLGAFGHFHEQRELGLLALLEVVGIDGLRLVGHRDAGAAGLEAGLGGLLEFARMEQRPGRQHLVVLRQRLGVAGMQP
jgi:WS/DGAT/MGAT family acyltransferase